MGQWALRQSDDPAYLCRLCSTFVALSSILKSGIKYRYEECFHFTNCYNIKENETAFIQNFKYSTIQYVEDPPVDDYSIIECKRLYCKRCNGFKGWKVKPDKYILIKNKLK